MRPKERGDHGASPAHRGPRGIHRAEEEQPDRRDSAGGRHGMNVDTTAYLIQSNKSFKTSTVKVYIS